MSATEILRRMLDERGVEWTKPKSATEFIQTTFLRNGWGIEVLERNIGLCVTATNIFDTPEQAIAATVGGGECVFEINTDATAIRCNKCGYQLPVGTDLEGTRFCGGCGRPVKR